MMVLLIPAQAHQLRLATKRRNVRLDFIEVSLEYGPTRIQVDDLIRLTHCRKSMGDDDSAHITLEFLDRLSNGLS